MTLNDVLIVAGPDIEVDLYLNDRLNPIGTIRPLYALKYLALDFRSLEVKEVRGSNYDCKLSVIVSTREEK
ncbi:hypothetical protein DWV75_02350 [Ruminococcus sp. AF12-5]|nr:hypothetical protein DWV75_02350 [Ruminococcus sp. AF12-5]DAO17852.1 MAG TPA: hypothetical protein [Caudoviricetes sp.]